MSDTKKCPNCGADNDISFSLCQQCMTPLTAYAGQLDGESYKGKLATQVAALNQRPHSIVTMMVYHVLVAILIPLRIFVGSLPGKESADPDQVYQASMSTAFHSIGAVVVGLVMIPLAIALIYLAWGTWAQRTWAWNAAFAPLIVAVIMLVTNFHQPSVPLHIFSGFALAVSAVVIYMWYRPDTKSWFGL